MLKRSALLALIFLFIVSFSSKELPEPYKFPELKFFPPMPVTENNPVTVQGAELGRHLFYDPILSGDSSISCASCHRQEAAFSDAPLDFSKGINGTLTKRNAMPLFNLAWYPAFFWDGRAVSIEEQAFHPVRGKEEMNLQWNVAVERLRKSKFYKPMFAQAFGKEKVDSVLVTRAIAQFLRTLISYQSKYDEVITGRRRFTRDEFDGFVLVNDQTKGDCIHCHTTDGDALGTTLVFSNNGLDAAVNATDYKDKGRGEFTGRETDYGKFIVPSLRNLAFTAPYMHDGRFKTLEEVIEFYISGVKAGVNTDSKMGFAYAGGVNLSSEEKRKVIAFLLTLSDSSFISKKEFSNPFIKELPE
jgi:cytochrome c peroxidase